jgi:flagellar protein FlbD
MICVTRIKGQTVALNPDLIESVEEMPDTTIRLVSGEKILVRETLRQLVQLAIAYRRELLEAFGTDPLQHVGRPRTLPPGAP